MNEGLMTSLPSHPVVAHLSNLSEEEFIRGIVEGHPEMIWLTGDVQGTPDAPQGGEDKSPGEMYFPSMDKEQLKEFNRTLVGILVLRWVLLGDHAAFTACQDDSARLSGEGFGELRSYVMDLLPDEEALEAMITYMVINDITKVKSVVEDFAQRTGIRNADHDKLLRMVLEQQPGMSPSYVKLSDRYKHLILDGLKADFNIGQLIQGESVPASLNGLSGIGAESLDFYLLHALCDIGGAAGHQVQNGSAILTQQGYLGFKYAIEAIRKLATGSPVVEVYDHYLLLRSYDLETVINDDESRALVRLCCMLRMYQSGDVQKVKEVWRQLPSNVRVILIHELGRNGTDDGWAILPYYAPAMLANLLRSMYAHGHHSAFSEALQTGLLTLARLYQEARIHLRGRTGNGVFTCMASALARMAASAPHSLAVHDIRLHPQGDDAEVELIPFPCIDESLFPAMDSLAALPGSTFIVGGMGGGSDVVQAAHLASLLQQAGKQVKGIFSVRTQQTGSQDKDGKSGQVRTPLNATFIAEGVYRMQPDTFMQGRTLEPLVAEKYPTYLILLTQGAEPSPQLRSLIAHLGGADTLLGVDTGGDSLFSHHTSELSRFSPDQDITVVRAIGDLKEIKTLSALIATGVDAPADAEEKLLAAGAEYFSPSAHQANAILKQYKAWGMDGSHTERYGKTALAWQKALANELGMQTLDLPRHVVLNHHNPWNPFVYVQPCFRGIFFMQVSAHLNAINPSLHP